MDHNELRRHIEKITHENYFFKTDQQIYGKYNVNKHHIIIWFLVHFAIYKVLSFIFNLYN